MSTPSPLLLRALGDCADGLTAEVYDTLESTNTLAKSRACEDTPALYIARTQTGGRGRLGRSFHSPTGTGLYMTVAYTTSRPLTEAVRVTAAAAVAALSAVEALTRKHPSVKWVNDIYLDGCKIGGILTEAVSRADGYSRMAVGLGLNLTTTDFPDDLRAPASCLFAKEAPPADMTAFADTLAGEITRRLLELVEASPTCPFAEGMWGEACLDYYRRHLLYIGESVVCTRGTEGFEGIALGVDSDYALLVAVNGETLTLSSGEISLRPVKKT